MNSLLLRSLSPDANRIAILGGSHELHQSVLDMASPTAEIDIYCVNCRVSDDRLVVIRENPTEIMHEVPNTKYDAVMVDLPVAISLGTCEYIFGTFANAWLSDKGAMTVSVGTICSPGVFTTLLTQHTNVRFFQNEDGAYVSTTIRDFEILSAEKSRVVLLKPKTTDTSNNV